MIMATTTNTAPDWLGTPTNKTTTSTPTTSTTTKTTTTTPTTNPTVPTTTAPNWLGTPTNTTKTTTTTPTKTAPTTTAPTTTNPTVPWSAPTTTAPTKPPVETLDRPDEVWSYDDNLKKRALELQSEGKTKQQISNQLNIEKQMWKFGTPTTTEPAPTPNKNTIKTIAQRNARELWKSADSMVDALVRWNDLERGTPEYEVAKWRVKDMQVLSTLSPTQIANSVLKNEILPGSQKLLDLQKYYPELALQVQEEYVKQSQLWMINDFGAWLYSEEEWSKYNQLSQSKLESQKEEKTDYFDALAWTVFESFASNMWDDAQEMLAFVQAQLNDPKIITQKEKVIGLVSKKDELELLIKNTEDQVRGEMPSEAPEAFISAYIQEMTWDLYDKLDSVNRSLFTEQSMLTAYTDTANQNIQIFQSAKQMDMDQKQAEAEAEAEQRKFEYTAMMDQAKLEMDYAKMAMDQEQNVFDRQKFYTQMGFDEKKFQWDQQKYMNDQEWDAYKFQTEMDAKELERYYDMMMDDNAPIQMKSDIYDYLFNGIKPWTTPQMNPWEAPTMDVSSWYIKNIGYGKITSFWGTHDNYQGIDIDWEIGDPIPSPGWTVVWVWTWNGVKGQKWWYGNYVDIKDDQWYVHRYGHLDQINVKNWQVVPKWTVFWTIGNTWYVIAWPGNNGSHLDYSIKKPWGWFMKSKEALQYIQTRDAIKWGFEITNAKPNLSPVKSKALLTGIQLPTQINPNLSPVKNPADIFSASPQTRSFFFPQPELPYNPFRQQQTQTSTWWSKEAILAIANKFYETWSIDTNDLKAMWITADQFREQAPKLYIESKAQQAKQFNFNVTDPSLLMGKSAVEMRDIMTSLSVANDLIQKMTEYKDLYTKYGTESRPTEAKRKMEVLHTDITLWLKEKAAWYNLWVLNGKDREILVKSFPETTSKRLNPMPGINISSAIDQSINNMKSRIGANASRFGLKYQPWYSNISVDNPLWLNISWWSNNDPLSLFK
jgi:murein DD-endopeptidase MepM/ murein hydrolase activator NlpD